MDNMAYFAAGTLFALPGIIGLFTTNCKDLRTFTVVAFAGSLLNMVTTSYGIGGSIVFLVCCGITYSCLKNLKIFFITSLAICLWLIAFLYYQLFVVGTINGDIFLQYGLSKNYPGSLLVIFNCLWAAWKYMYYRKLPILLPILSTVMAFFLDGRSSLICLLLITVFCFIFRGNGKSRTITVIIMASLFAVLLFRYWGLIEDYYELTSLSEKGLDATTRTVLWKSYFDHLDIGSIIFGLDTQNLPFLKDNGGNPHNTFLSFHRRLGLVGISILIYYIFKIIKTLLRRKSFVILFLVAVLVVRMFFDGMLVTAEDFFILTLFFIPLCYNNKVFDIEKQINTHGNNWFERVWDKIAVFI